MDKVQYTKMKEWTVSRLGLGTMRLPCNEDESIDEVKAIDMIRHAIDSGINYVDTAYFYHQGNSEIVTGKALKNGYRDRIYLADKLPIWKCDTKADMQKVFDDQLKKLGTDRIDNYLLHALDTDNWAKCREFGAFEWATNLKKQGKIKHLGFSFHDQLTVFKSIIDYAPSEWDFCQIQYNLIDTHYQAGVEGLKYANSKGIPVVVMEPLKGGALVNVPQAIKDKFPIDKTGYDYSDIALKYLANQSEVTIVLSGMTKKEHVDSNLKSVNAISPNSLDKKACNLIQEMQQAYKLIHTIPCSNCKYCQPCPQNILIPELFNVYNDALSSQATDIIDRYKALLLNNSNPAKCVACGQCESKCPQKISIIEKLKEVNKKLG